MAHDTVSTGVMGISVTFHEPVVWEDWLLYHHESTQVGRGMSHVRGQVFTEEGAADRLVHPGRHDQGLCCRRRRWGPAGVGAALTRSDTAGGPGGRSPAAPARSPAAPGPITGRPRPDHRPPPARSPAVSGPMTGRPWPEQFRNYMDDRPDGWEDNAGVDTGSARK